MTLQRKNWKGNILRIWITIIRHGGLGHEVQESWPYLSNATPSVISASPFYCDILHLYNIVIAT